MFQSLLTRPAILVLLASLCAGPGLAVAQQASDIAGLRTAKLPFPTSADIAVRGPWALQAQREIGQALVKAQREGDRILVTRLARRMTAVRNHLYAIAPKVVTLPATPAPAVEAPRRRSFGPTSILRPGAGKSTTEEEGAEEDEGKPKLGVTIRKPRPSIVPAASPRAIPAVGAPGGQADPRGTGAPGPRNVGGRNRGGAGLGRGGR